MDNLISTRPVSECLDGRAESAGVLSLDADDLRFGPDGCEPWQWTHIHSEHWSISRNLLTQLARIFRELNKTHGQSARNVTLLGNRLMEAVSAFAYWGRIGQEASKHHLVLQSQSCGAFARLVLDGVPIEDDFLLRLLRNGAKSGIGARFPWLRLAKEVVVRDGFRRRPPALTDMEQHIVTVSRQPLIDRVAKAESRPINILPLGIWFPEVPEDVAAKVQKMHIHSEPINEFLDALSGLFRDVDLPLSAPAQSYLEHMLSEGSRWIDFHFQRIEKKNLKLPKNLWIGSSGIIWNRLLASLVRERGGHVTAFDHAQGANLTCRTLFAFNESQQVDRFVTFSEAHADNYRNSFRELAVSDTPPEVIVAPVYGFEEPVPSLSRKDRTSCNDAVRRALYIAPCVTSSEVGPYGLMTTIPSFDWQARLISMLRNLDFTVGVKPHPESPVSHPGYFSELENVHMLEGRSEDHLANYDIIILDFPFQTSFGQALRTTQPIVFIDMGVVEYSPEQRRALEQRCAVVEGRFDNDGRMRVDPEMLAAAVRRAPELRGTSFLCEIDSIYRNTEFSGD